VSDVTRESGLSRIRYAFYLRSCQLFYDLLRHNFIDQELLLIAGPVAFACWHMTDWRCGDVSIVAATDKYRFV